MRELMSGKISERRIFPCGDGLKWYWNMEIWKNDEMDSKRRLVFLYSDDVYKNIFDET